MSEQSGIEWTDSTWNPWVGCTKVSPGCRGCYMFREQERYGQDPTIIRRSKTTFTAPLKWSEPRMVFTCSWSDFFHEEADLWRIAAWDVIRRSPQHTYQVLTKRPQRIAQHLPDDWGEGWPNVWLGTSIESRGYLYRLDHLATIPAAVRFVSAEPLIGSLILGDKIGTVDWVIVGGESGPKCRLMQHEWARNLLDECGDAGVPFFFKQWGGWPDKRAGAKAILDGERYTEMPAPKPFRARGQATQ